MGDVSTDEVSGQSSVNVTDATTLTNTGTSHGMHGAVETSLILTFAGTGIAIFGIILTLFSYLCSKKFRVKRTHMVLINLCFCLLIYFIAYAISNFERHRVIDHSHAENALCTAGAFLTHVSTLWSWFWIASYWGLVLIMYQRPVRSHIHHFFIKAALPCYGVPLLASVLCIVVATSLGHKENSTYTNKRCFVQNGYLYGGLMAPFFFVASLIIAVFVYILHGLLFRSNAEREARNKKRVQIHLIKLTIITIIACIVFLSTLIVPASTPIPSTTNMVSEYIYVASSIALGILLMILFCLLQAEIRLHWSTVLTGSSRLKHRTSLSVSKYDGVATFDSRKTSSASRQPMIQVDPNISAERKSSTIRIVPKEDEDLSNLNLIQIPQESATKNEEKRKSKQMKRNDSSVDKSLKKKSKEKNNDVEIIDAAQHSKTTPQDPTAEMKRRPDDSVRERSRTGSRLDKTSIKRRSFSTSCVKPEGSKQLSLLRRQSVLSNDSTCMTSFD